MRTLNEQRADVAAQTLMAYQDYRYGNHHHCTPEQRETSLRDLLTDLMHNAELVGDNFDYELARARLHYRAQIEEVEEDS